MGVAVILFRMALDIKLACRSLAVKARPFCRLISLIKICVKLVARPAGVVVSHPAAVRISPSGLIPAIPELHESIINRVSQRGTRKAN